MPETKIEWADDSENAASGCSEAVLPSGKMDPACVNCYARLMSARLDAMGQPLYAGVATRTGNAARWSGVFRWDEAMMRRKFDRMKGGHRVFFGSMTDLWHKSHQRALGVALADNIKRMDQRPPAQRPYLIILTKRAEALLEWQREHFPDGLPAWVWPGVTAGCQEAADFRVPILLQVMAKGPRVVSVEPMTGPVDMSEWLKRTGFCGSCGQDEKAPPDDDEYGTCPVCGRCEWTIRHGDSLFGPELGWIICGGESGAKARPSHPDWFRSLRDQCVAAGVPFHFKQHGEFLPTPDISEGDAVVNGLHMTRVGKKVAGRTLDGRTWDEVPTGANP